MHQYLRPRKTMLQLFLDAVHALVVFGDCPVGRDPDMELGEVMRPARARAKVVETGKLRIFPCRGEELLALLLRPLAIHKLIEPYPMNRAERVMMITWMSAASASALPWPNR